MRPIHPLTSLRFFAALWVVLYHTLPLGPWEGFVKLGFLGVPLFFVLSGFVLAYNYDDRLEEIGQKEFLQARFARIFPMLFFATLLSAVLAAGTHLIKVSTIGVAAVATLTFLLAWFPIAGLNSPAWSLSDEALFYVLFRPLAAKLRAIRSSDAIYWIVGFSVVSAVLPYTLLPFLGNLATKDYAGRLIATNPIVRFPSFCVGLVAAGLFMRGTADQIARIMRPGFLLACVVLIGIGVWFRTSFTYGSKEFYNYFMQAGVSGIFTFPMCVLIFLLATMKGRLATILSSKPLILLGEASYSMYLIHFPLWGLTGWLMARYHALHFWIVWPIFCVFVIVASVASFTYIETPARRLLRPKKVPSRNPPILVSDVIAETVDGDGASSA